MQGVGGWVRAPQSMFVPKQASKGKTSFTMARVAPSDLSHIWGFVQVRKAPG